MESNAGLGKFLSGAAVGGVLSFLYLVYGYQPPAVTRVFDIPKEAAAFAMSVVADEVLYDPAANLEDQQRAIAFKVGTDHKFFREVDAAIDNRFTNEVLRRHASDQAIELRIRYTAFDKIFEHAALRELYEKRYGTTDPTQLKRRMLIDAIRDETFLHRYLQGKHPGESDDRLAAHILESRSLTAP